MYYVLTLDNKLFAICKTPPYGNEGSCSVHEFDGIVPDINSYDWNPLTESLEILDGESVLTKLQFLSLFTISERIQIMSSTDPIMQDISRLFDASQFINIKDNKTIQSLGYFYQQGILTQSRYMELTTWPQPHTQQT